MNPASHNNVLKNPEKKTDYIPEKALKVLASSIFQNLREEGCKEKDILGISSQLISLVTSEISSSRDKTP